MVQRRWDWGRSVILLAGVAGAVLILRSGAAAEDPWPADTRALRRTPVVEVVERYKDTVVFVTGPVAKADQPAAEFFEPGTKGPHENGIGTGFIIHESGYIVANAHSVEKLVFPVVVLSDGKPYAADVLASLHNHDLALLKINAGRPLKAVHLGRSGDVMVGETVIVIANPHGLMHTCTTGVLSAAGRKVELADVPGVALQNVLQSGGPWFNVAGEVIGFTTSMRKDAENIAFAIPASTLHQLLPDMLDVCRRYGIVTGMDVAGDGPCRVAGVERGSPAAAAGIRPGDFITRLAGRPTPTITDYHLALIGRKPGDSIAVQFTRDGKPQEASLTLGGRPKPDTAALLKKKLGLEVAPLDGAKAKAMGLRVPRGVVVAAVDPDFYAKLEHRPKPGDVLARIGQLRPRDADQIALLLEKAQPKQSLPLVFVRRDGNVGSRIDVNYIIPP